MSVSTELLRWGNGLTSMGSLWTCTFTPFLNPIEEFFSSWRWKVYDRRPYTRVNLLQAMDLACGDLGEESCQAHKRLLPPLPQKGQYCLWCRRSALAWLSPKIRRCTLITCLLLWFLSLLVLYTVVQCIVGCILHNEQMLWPWTLCFPFVNSTDCSIDFDWLQVHINNEKELQYHRDEGQFCEMQGLVL